MRSRLQARARFAIVQPNGAIAAADLPLTSWCAIYCVAAPAAVPPGADSATLRLYEPRLADMFLDASTGTAAAAVSASGTMSGSLFPARWRFFPPRSCTKWP